MKKFLTITVTLIALWAVSASIIGNQTQEEFQNYLDKSNQLYAKSGLKFSLSDYNKSFLTSTATMEVDFLDSKLSEVLQKEYLLPIKVHYTIEHGPLFFKNGFGVGLSKIENNLKISSLLQPKTKEEFLKLVKDDINLNSDMVISFGKELHYTIESDAVQISQDNRNFQMTPLHFKGKTNIETFKGVGKLSIDNVTFEEENSSNGMTLTDLAMDIKIDEIIKNSLLLGDFKFSIANLMVNDDTNPAINTINVALEGKVSNRRTAQTTMKSSFETEIDLKDTKLPAEFKELQKVYLSMNLEALGIEGMFQFQQVAQEAQEEQSRLLEQLQNSSQEEMQLLFQKFETLQNKMLTKLIHSLNALLIKDKTAITYLLNIDTKDKASSKAEVEIGYTGDIAFKGTIEELTAKLKAEILSLIRLNVDIELNKKHLKLLPIPTLAQQLQMGVSQGFIKENNSSYSLNGYYKNRELMVNDNNLTATVLPLLMMLTAQ